MATKEDISDMLKFNKMEYVFELPTFGGRTSENAKEFLSSFNNYCKLNRIDGQDKMMMFEMCLSSTAKFWYLTLSEQLKKNFESLTEQFNHDYLQNNQWLNSTRLENRKLLSTESAEKYIADMSDLALLVDIEDTELSKALIRGLPTRLKWNVVSFNPTTLSEIIQRILLGEATLSFVDNERINVVSENGMVTTVQRMDERLDELEDLLKSCPLSRTAYPVATNQPLPAQSDIVFNECEMNGHDLSECSPSNNISTYGDSQLLNSVLRDSFYFPEEEE